MACRLRRYLSASLIVWFCLSFVPGRAPITSAQPAHVVQHPVYVEDSPAAQELGLEAKDLAGQGRYADAAQKLQEMIEDYPHKLMPTGDSTYIDALLWARNTLLDEPRLLEAYRSLYQPAAERAYGLALATVDKPIDADGLRQVLTRYTQTRAGLEAGLALAAYHLERAEGGDASGVMDELSNHPDLPVEAGRYHLLRAVASMLEGDTVGYEAARRTLADLADDARLSELDALSNRVHPPLRLQPGERGAGSRQAQLPENLDAPLWDIDLLDGILQVNGRRPSLRGFPADQVLLRVIPASDSEKVYVNRGERITAYDRASGWQVWEVLDRQDVLTDPQMFMPGRGLLTEPRSVFVDGGVVYGLLGWMNPNRNIQQANLDGVSLVAIDSEAGTERWRVQPGELDAALEESAFDGTPVGDSGRLYALVKRVRTSGLHDLYIVAVRQADGGLIWRRHLSSSSTQTHYNALPSARMLLHAGRVYVSDNRGTVYALDGRTGTVRWVTMLPDAGDAVPASRRYVAAVKDPPSPILIEAGLLIPPITLGGSYLLLEADNGVLMRTLDDRDWQDIDACFAGGGDVIGVGGEVICFDGGTLKPRWRHALDETSEGRVRGRPAIRAWRGEEDDKTDGLAVVSTDQRLMAMSLRNGRVLSDHAAESPGNVMLTTGQVVLATTGELNAYTDWQDAHRQLVMRAEENPADPQPGMALARLAMRTGRDDAVLEGVDMSLASLENTERSDTDHATLQRSVFLMLRAFIDPANGAGVALRGELLDRMAVSTVDAEQEAAYQLTRGLYQQELGEPGRAVEHFQAVLADRAMASQLYKVGRGSRRAGLEARRLLEGLIKQYGREVYQPYDLLAEHELGELQLSAEHDPRRYADLAERYPLAHCVNQARMIAADLSLDAGETTLALRQLQAVYLNSDRIDGLPEVAARVAQVHLDQQRPDLARRWLRRVEREHPDLQLTRGDQATSTQAWLAELDYVLSSEQLLPGLTPPLAEPQWIDGRPVAFEEDAQSGDVAHDGVLMTDGKSVWMLTTPSLNEVWRRPIPDEDMRVLSQDDRQVLWWSKNTGRIGAWDSRTGEPLWSEIDCKLALDEAGDPQSRLEQRTNEQREFIQLLGGGAVRRAVIDAGQGEDSVLVRVDLATVLIADNLGRAVCIDRQTGAVRWRTLSVSDTVTAAALGDDLVALVGASWADTEAQHGVVTLLDTLTGEPLETQIQSEDVPTWLGFADNGLLITMARDWLSGYDPASGRTQWRTELPRTAGSDRVDIGGRLMIVSSNRLQAGSAQVGSVLILDTDTGEVVNQLPYRTVTGQPPMFMADEADGQWHTLTPMRAVSLSASGRTQWADALCAPIGHLVLQKVGRDALCVVGLTGKTRNLQIPEVNFRGDPQIERILRVQIEAGQLRVSSGEYRLYLLDRATGRIVSDTALGEMPAMMNPQASVFTDGALLLGVRDRTLVVRGSDD